METIRNRVRAINYPPRIMSIATLAHGEATLGDDVSAYLESLTEG